MNRFEAELIVQQRQMENLLADLERLIPYFETKTITDIFVYEKGNVTACDFEKGTFDTGIVLSVAERMRIINSLASVSDIPINKWERPTLESIIPKYNIRTTAIMSPWTVYPEITFRRPAEKIFTLEDYLQEKRISQKLYDFIVEHIKKRSNIVISGSTGSGKTTFTNACICKMLDFTPNERIYIVEDTPELQCASPNKTQVYIRKDQAVAAIQTALRWTPKRIIFGELRSGEVVVELLEAWNTGHPGNITTIHADSAASTIPRIEGLLRQVIKGQLPNLADNIQLIVNLSFRPDFGPVVNEARTVREIQEARKMT
jgi:type IV secretion system protein VirB11